jgi:hypothetical protein
MFNCAAEAPMSELLTLAVDIFMYVLVCMYVMEFMYVYAYAFVCLFIYMFMICIFFVAAGPRPRVSSSKSAVGFSKLLIFAVMCPMLGRREADYFRPVGNGDTPYGMIAFLFSWIYNT